MLRFLVGDSIANSQKVIEGIYRVVEAYSRPVKHFFFPKYMLRSGIAGSYRNSTFEFLKRSTLFSIVAAT